MNSAATDAGVEACPSTAASGWGTINRRSTSAVEKHVAARVRQRRIECGLSQSQVAEMIGVTYRQMYKYERGINRIPVASLHEIASLLGMPVDDFYEGLAKAETRPNAADSPMLLETIRHFAAIKNEKHLAAFSQLVRALAGQ